MASIDTGQVPNSVYDQKYNVDGERIHEIDGTSRDTQKNELLVTHHDINHQNSEKPRRSQLYQNTRSESGFAEFIPNINPVHISQDGFSDLPEPIFGSQSPISSIPNVQSVEKPPDSSSRPKSLSIKQAILLASGLVIHRRQEYLLEIINEQPFASSTHDKHLIYRLLSWIRYLILAIIILILLLVVLVSLASTGHVSHPSSNKRPPPTHPSTVPDVPNPTASNFTTLKPKIIAGSPLVSTAFHGNSHDLGIGIGATTSAIFIFYQAIDGHVRNIMSDSDPQLWQPSNDLFNDAVNNTGLAATSYLNGSAHQLSLFYISSTSQLREKRLYGDGTYVWQPAASLIDEFITVDGTKAFQWPNETSNGFDSFRVAAIYSSNFSGGPETHLFYHGSDGSVGGAAQELIWTQNNDTWSYGSQFGDAVSSSHFAAVVDGSFLHFYYVSTGPVLRESLLSMDQPGAKWQDGQIYPNLLLHHNSEFAVISTPSAINLYFYHSSTSANTTEPLISIYELALLRVGSTISPESLSPVMVATPALLAAASEYHTASTYAPVSATVSNNTVIVCYTAGVDNAQGGYGELQCVSRDIDGSWGPNAYGNATGQVELPI